MDALQNNSLSANASITRGLDSRELETLLPEMESEWFTETETTLRVVIGRTTLTADEMQEVKRGTVVALDEAIDEPVEIYSGDKLIARGRLLEMDQKFAIEITELTAWG